MCCSCRFNLDKESYFLHAVSNFTTMDFKPVNENLSKPAKSLPQKSVTIIENLLKEGKTCEDVAKLAEVRKQTVVDVRKQMEVDGKMEMGSWKREVSNLLGEFALKGAKRLVDEIDTMPIGQVTMAVAIAVDKVRDLTDTPTIKVEARLKISQDELNKAFGLDSKPLEVIDIDSPQNNT